MFRLNRLLAGLTLILGAGTAIAMPEVRPGQPAPPIASVSAAACLPEGVLIVVSLRDGDQQIPAFRRLLDEQQVEESAAYHLLNANPQIMQARIGLAGLAMTAGTDVWGALGAVLGRDLTIGIVPGEGKNARFIGASITRDAPTLGRLLDAVHVAAGLVKNGTPDPARSELIDGVRVFKTENNVWHGLVGDTVFLGNSRDLLRAALGARANAKGRLSDLPLYRDAAAQVPEGAPAWAFVNMAGIRAALGPERALPEQVNNPLGGFLFGGWWRTIVQSDGAVAWATASPRTLTLDLAVSSTTPTPASHAGFVVSGAPAPRWSSAALPGYAAELSVTRDWASLFAERESILTLPAAGQIVNFSNVLTTLMGQLDFTEQVLPAVRGPMRLIIARQDLSALPYQPSPRLPAFALVAPLKFDPNSDFPRRLYTAAQMAMSFVNADAAQKQQPAYLIDTDRYRGTRILIAEYPDPTAHAAPGMDGPGAMTPADSKRADAAPPAGAQPAEAARPTPKPTVSARYNISPAAAVVDGHFVIATSPALLKQIIDAIADGAEGKAAGPGAAGALADTLTLRVPPSLQMLRDNREELIVNRMLEKDLSKEQAGRDVDAFFGLIGFLDRLSLTSKPVEHGYRATLAVTLREPPVLRSPPLPRPADLK